MTPRTFATVILYVFALGSAVAQQQSVEQKGLGGNAQLQRRPDAVKKVEKTPPPEPLKSAQTMETAKTPNGNAVYQALRSRSASGQSFRVKGLTLRRDAAEFHLKDGTVTLYNEVNGRVTGAVFQGQGVLHVEPPSAMERHQLKLTMKSEVLDQPFTTAVLAFTDGTAEELKRASTGDVVGNVNAMSLSQEMQNLCRKTLNYDLEERLLADVLNEHGGGFFMANLKGPIFSKRLLYFVDPKGAFEVAPEEIGLLTSADDSYDVALGFHSEAQRAMARAKDNTAFGISQQTIDLTIEKSGRITGKATALVTSNEDGLRVLPLNLYPTLRASGVWGPKGEALDYIQEDKDHDSDFAVVLVKSLKKGESIAITTAYAGKDVISNLGNWNYEVEGGARESWYPNVRGSFGNYAYYRMTFHTPKEIEMVATGTKLRDGEENKMRVSEWQTSSPIPVAGFNLGRFTTDLSERKSDLQVRSYANTDPSDSVNRLSGHVMGGSMSTTGMLKRATSEGDVAVQIYTDYFGPLEFDHLALTQQSYCGYGQSWPMLVYLPVCYFWDATIQHQLGVLEGDTTYWKVVTPHEVAHQWWGQTVGFSSYRDQWMSEGFADFSASLFLFETSKDMKPYQDFWAEERRRLLTKNVNGMRPVDVGPVVMGMRVSSSRSGGGVYQSLIYPKGAYILHMLQMLYWTPQYKNELFKKAMHDFIDTYRDKAATTEDFKAVMEKNLPPWLNLDGNKKLDWFFNDYVYGTEVPSYTITSQFEKKGDETTVHLKLAQSGVSEDFTMLVPVYLELEDKRVVLVGRARMKGPHELEQTLDLGKLGTAPKRLLVNYYYDVLSAN
jgi:Peptidase family M1 domain